MRDRPPLRTLVVLWLTLWLCRLVMPLAYGLLLLGLQAEMGIVVRFVTWACRTAERAIAANYPR